MKLCQVIAIEPGKRTEAQRAERLASALLTSPTALSGRHRSYQPLSDDPDAERYPAEMQKVTATARGILEEMQNALAPFYDTVATKDYANMAASADVVVDGVTLIKGAPVPFLLFLEKQLEQLASFSDSLPVLSPEKDWDYDHAKGHYVSDPVQTTKTKKVPRVIQLARATDKHPEQTHLHQEDVPVGHWTTQEWSGALQSTDVQRIRERVRTLIAAVRVAREEANSATVETRKVGELLLDFIFAAS